MPAEEDRERPGEGSGDGGATGIGDGGPAAGPVGAADRRRFEALLDRAAERGLLSGDDYAIRRRELAEAATGDQMLAVVTDLTPFRAGQKVRLAGPERRPPSPGELPSRGAGAGRSAAPPWVLLVVMVALAVAALVALGLVAAHVHRGPAPAPPSSTAPLPRPGPAVAGQAFSVPRP